ncbi:hypothetical protein FisN_5Lh412 [Fistulifera solaris]|uniref:Metallo-beta-lactamase domain-containing protein n=1 Tax=Fistulifera solaris TaxID=1519565 RepID=A0A1Z5KH00_FISSO|nr:hypothetical protein FisN_5Lh412 [Fistulifera solaris]|eukprot:GAX25321.1 hypothetical protein FisN_5Lh412 [Fistulifera solaris]
MFKPASVRLAVLLITAASAWVFSPSNLSPSTALRSTSQDKNDITSPRRRAMMELAIAAAGLTLTYAGTKEIQPTDYGLWGILPVGTYKSKKTIRETIVPDQIWTFDQKFGILDVQVPLRMTIIKRKNGLFVYNPIAATPECLQLVQELVQRHGPIRDIVVGSVALEHKVYAGVFAQKFPEARIWLTPGQYSFPINLPDPYLGFPAQRTRTVPRSLQEAPEDWKEDLDVSVLGPIISRDGAFGETVILHKPTRTLLVTDTAVQVTDEIPAIYETDPAPLLYHARDTVTDVVTETPETLKKGWKRVVLFGLFFMPSAITIKDVGTALNERRPDINADFAGVYPWDWVGDEEASWKGLTGTAPGGKPLVAPILQTLLLNRSPVEVLDFADQVATWDFQRIIPAHLKNNLPFGPKDYRGAFGFLEESGVPQGFPKPLKADLQALLDAEEALVASGAIVPAPPKVGGKFSRAEILAQTSYKCRANFCSAQSQP